MKIGASYKCREEFTQVQHTTVITQKNL